MPKVKMDAAMAADNFQMRNKARHSPIFPGGGTIAICGQREDVLFAERALTLTGKTNF